MPSRTRSAAKTPAPPPPPDRLLVAWAGDVPRIKEFLEAHGAKWSDLYHSGTGARWKVTIHQITPKLTGNRISARIGDTLRFDGASLVVDKRPVRHRTPPPGVAAEPVRRARRDRDRGAALT